MLAGKLGHCLPPGIEGRYGNIFREKYPQVVRESQDMTRIRRQKACFEEYEVIGLDYHGIEVVETITERFGKVEIDERGKEAQRSIGYKKG